MAEVGAAGGGEGRVRADRGDVAVALQVLERMNLTVEDLVEGVTTGVVPTFAELAPRVVEGVSEGSRPLYRSYLNRLVAAYGSLRSDEFDVDRARAFVAHVRETADLRRSNTGGNEAARHAHRALSLLYRYAVDHGLIGARQNVMLRVAVPPARRAKRHALSPQLVAEILAVARSTGHDPALDALLLRFHLETAARVGGALRLRLCDLDAGQSLVRLREKGSTQRWQPVSATLMTHLFDHARERGARRGEDGVLGSTMLERTRHNRSAPFADAARHSGRPANPRSAITKSPLARPGNNSRAEVASALVIGPSVAATIAWVPHSATATTRTCGNAARSPLAEVRALPGRPNRSALSGVSGTSKVVPSTASTRQCRYHDSRVAGSANGLATCSNSAFGALCSPGVKLRIHHAAAGQDPQWRTVDPIGLVTVRDQGYLAATRSGADRTYRLSRVLAAEELAEPTQRPDRVDLGRAWQERGTRFRAGGDQVAVLVRVHPARREDLVGTALGVLAEDADADGWLRLEVTFQDPRHAEWALWQLSTNAEALAPQWLRTSLHDRAAAIVTRYGAPT